MKSNFRKGNAHYKEALQIMRSPNGDFEKAKKLLLLGLEENDPFSAYALGTWYFFGSNGIRKNTKKGLALWHRAAEEKVPDALFDLAVYYEKDAIEKDLKKAFLLYIDAAIRGDKEALFAVGRCYFFGIGVSKNKDIAEIWFQRSEEFGTYEQEN